MPKLIERLEDRTLFSLPFGSATTTPITLNPQGSVALVNVVSGPLLSADFNNDGKADLVFGGRSAGADDSNTHYLGVMLGSATGAFTDAGTLAADLIFGPNDPVEAPISAYATGDFNNDGNQDLAAIYTIQNGSSSDYHLLVGFGNGDGTFTLQPGLDFDTTTFIPSDETVAPASIAVAKFDPTSNDDQMAVVLPNDSTTESLDVLGLDSTNHFARLSEVPLFGLNGGDDQIVAGHFDSGTIPDVAVYDPIASQAMIVSTGGGDDFLGFDPIAIAPPPAFASFSVIAAGDFNSDGKTDLVVEQTAMGINATNLYVLQNNGFGGATALPPVSDLSSGPTNTTLDWLKVADFENNGNDEVATRFGLFRSDLTGKLLYSGLGTFTDTDNSNAVVGDFNGDGALDLVSVASQDADSIEFKPGATSSSLDDIIMNLTDQSAKNGVGAVTAAQFSATVNGANSTPTGTVDFFATDLSNNNAVDLGTVALIDGVATITPSDMPVGTKNVFAAYSGDAVFLGGQSDEALTVSYVGGGSNNIKSFLESGIIKSTLPGSAVTGSKLNKSVTVSVKNTDSEFFKDQITVNIFASSDVTIDPSDTLIGTATKTVRINAGKTTNFVIQIKSLPASLSGLYLMLGETVEGNVQTSTTLQGPLFSVAAPFISLVPANISMKINPNGSSVTLFTVTNNGNIPSTGISQLLLYGSSDATINNATLLVKKPLGIHLVPGKKTTIRLPANPLETQLGLASTEFVIEVIDPTGATETTSTGPRT